MIFPTECPYSHHHKMIINKEGRLKRQFAMNFVEIDQPPLPRPLGPSTPTCVPAAARARGVTSAVDLAVAANAVRADRASHLPDAHDAGVSAAGAQLGGHPAVATLAPAAVGRIARPARRPAPRVRRRHFRVLSLFFFIWETLSRRKGRMGRSERNGQRGRAGNEGRNGPEHEREHGGRNGRGADQEGKRHGCGYRTP